MSAFFNVLGNANGPVYAALTTSIADIATPLGTNPHKVIGIRVVNVDNSNACRCGLYWHDGTNDRQFYNENIGAGASVFVDDPIVFGTDLPARKIRGNAGADNDLVVTVYVAVSTPQKS